LLRAAEKETYELVRGLSEYALRFGYTLIGLTSGEAFQAWTLLAATALSVLAGAAAIAGVRRIGGAAPRLVISAAFIAYVGAASWVSFVFMPAWLLFLVPFFV
jgi:hypothetical protein